MTRSARGKLIVLEGVDGAGKSTQFRLLREYLNARGVRVVADREPTDGEWGRKVREAAATGMRLPVAEEVEYLLRDRGEHVQNLIIPALKKGCWVLLDRYYPSMMAYQGAAGGDSEEIRRLNEEFAPPPDLALWLDIPVDLALLRVQGRGQQTDAFEQKEFLQAVARVYSNMNMPWWHRVDATGSTEDVQAKIQRVLRTRLEEGPLSVPVN